MDRLIKEQILQKLTLAEQEHLVKIPIAVESGSRSWGFASPDSDYDCRFIYIHKREWYLSVFEGKDTISYTPDAVFDIGGWDLRKAIQHITKSNAVMLEWLSSDVLYRMNESVHQELWVLAKTFFNPIAVCWHYLSLAQNKITEIESEETCKIKAYCYVLRPLACIRYIREHGEIPYMNYHENLSRITLGDPIREEISRLLAQKQLAKEGHPIPRNQILLSYFHDECEQAKNWLGSLKHEKNRDYEQANRTFRKLIEMMDG